jgi:hypothetical protein
MIAKHRRVATTDPPAPRSLAVELQRLYDQSSASAVLQAATATQVKARRDAQLNAAARAAPVETES